MDQKESLGSGPVSQVCRIAVWERATPWASLRGVCWGRGGQALTRGKLFEQLGPPPPRPRPPAVCSVFSQGLPGAEATAAPSNSGPRSQTPGSAQRSSFIITWHFFMAPLYSSLYIQPSTENPGMLARSPEERKKKSQVLWLSERSQLPTLSSQVPLQPESSSSLPALQAFSHF